MKEVRYTPTAVTTLEADADKVVITETTNVDGNLDRVKRLREADINHELLGRCVASIPISAISHWGAQFGLSAQQVVDDDMLLDRCISDYSKFKVHGGIH